MGIAQGYIVYPWEKQDLNPHLTNDTGQAFLEETGERNAFLKW